jgi:hypothetical protein
MYPCHPHLSSHFLVKANLGVEASADCCTALCQAVQCWQCYLHTLKAVLNLQGAKEKGPSTSVQVCAHSVSTQSRICYPIGSALLSSTSRIH